MSQDLKGTHQAITVFSNMYSILNPSDSVWPLDLTLPSPFSNCSGQSQHLPNIFCEEPKKKCKTVTACPHSARKHYAKNMCNNCYHRLGRDKTAWNCDHHDRKHYAKGKCQFCYLKHYNRSRQDVPVPVNIV